MDIREDARQFSQLRPLSAATSRRQCSPQSVACWSPIPLQPENPGPSRAFTIPLTLSDIHAPRHLGRALAPDPRVLPGRDAGAGRQTCLRLPVHSISVSPPLSPFGICLLRSLTVWPTVISAAAFCWLSPARMCLDDFIRKLFTSDLPHPESLCDHGKDEVAHAVLTFGMVFLLPFLRLLRPMRACMPSRRSWRSGFSTGAAGRSR